jgi:hypothetical protein
MECENFISESLHEIQTSMLSSFAVQKYPQIEDQYTPTAYFQFIPYHCLSLQISQPYSCRYDLDYEDAL